MKLRNPHSSPKFFADGHLYKLSKVLTKNPPPTKLSTESFGKNLFNPKKINIGPEAKNPGLTKFF